MKYLSVLLSCCIVSLSVAMPGLEQKTAPVCQVTQNIGDLEASSSSNSSVTSMLSAPVDRDLERIKQVKRILDHLETGAPLHSEDFDATLAVFTTLMRIADAPKKRIIEGAVWEQICWLESSLSPYLAGVYHHDWRPATGGQMRPQPQKAQKSTVKAVDYGIGVRVKSQRSLLTGRTVDYKAGEQSPTAAERARFIRD